MKNAFSLLELIFVIVIISIIATVAVPKFMDTRNTAQTASLKRDISSTVSSIQTYHLVNTNIDKISDAISLNTSTWILEDKKASFKEGSNDCVVIEIKEESSSKSLNLTINESAGPICKKLINDGLSSRNYELY